MQFGGNVWRFTPVDPKGNVMKTTTKPAALKAAKQNSSFVSKIKTKIQNTSSFFKVSLKTNNKALALALVSQKEKSRLLETETVHLRKEVQALCFDLALRRHKHNQLVTLLRDLHAGALSSLVAAVDLVSNEDVSIGPPEENEKSPPDSEDANMKLGSKVSTVPLLPKRTSVSPKKLTRESSGSLDNQPRNPSEGIHAQRNPSEGIPAQPSTDALPRVKASIGSTCNKGTETAEGIPPLQEKISRPSNLQLEFDKWSQLYLDIPPEPETLPVTIALNPAPIAEPLPEPLPEPASLEPRGPSGSPKGEPPRSEKTTLFETEMEITLANSTAEIVTVETKTKKSREEGMAKVRKKEGTQAYCSRPPDKGERKNKKEKSSSVCREATQSPDAPPTEGRSMTQRPVGPAEEEEEPGDGDADWFPARRNTHVTSRNTKRHHHSRDTPKSVGAFLSEPNLRKTYVISLDRNHTNAGSVTPLEDDYFSNTETYSSGIKDKEIPWDAATLEDEGPKGQSRRTYVVSTAQSGSSINRKTYVISDSGEPGSASTKSRRTKALPVRAENQSAVEGHAITVPAVEETSVLKRPSGPPQDPLALSCLAGKRKGLFSEGIPTSSKAPSGNPGDLDGLIMEKNPPWEILDPLSAVVEEPKPKRSRKESGIRARAKERKQRDDASTQMNKRKKKSRKGPDLDADVQASRGHSVMRRPAPGSPAGPEPKEFWAEPLEEDWGIVSDSVTSHKKNNLRKTNTVSLDSCGGSTNSVDTIANIQPLEFPVAGENEDAIKTVILAHVSADSTCAENAAYSGPAETQSRVVQKEGFSEPNVQVNPEETGIPMHQSHPAASGRMSVASDRRARGHASTKGQRSKAPPSRRESELEKEAHAGELSAGCAEETRESLKRLVMEERPFPLEPPDDICTSFPKRDVPSLRPASTPPPKPVLARVNVFEEQSDATTKSSPGKWDRLGLKLHCTLDPEFRAGAKERKQRDDASTQMNKRKKKSRKEPDLDTDVQASRGNSKTRRPAPGSPAGPEPKELWAEPLEEDWGIVTDSVTSHRKNNLRKTNTVSLDSCGGSTNSVDTIANIQLLEFPAAGENEDAIKTVTLAHVSADSTCAENSAYSGPAETQSRVVKKEGFSEPNVQVNPEETGIPMHQSHPAASGKMSVASDRRARGPASTKGQRSKAPPSRRESELEKEAHAGELSAGCAEETRESLKRLVMEERPFPLEPPDDICTSFPKRDVPSLRPASTPPPKPVLARVNVFEEQSDATTKSSPGKWDRLGLKLHCTLDPEFRAGAKERKQRDDASTQMNKRKKKSRKEPDLDTDVQASRGNSKTRRPAPGSPAGPELKELWAEPLEEDWGIVTDSVTSHRKNNLRKTNTVSLDSCGGSTNSVDAIANIQPLEFPAAGENEDAIKTVTLAHVSADSTCAENSAYSGPAETQSRVVKKEGFSEPNVQVNPEETGIPMHQSHPAASGKMSVASDRRARGPASTKGQRSKAPPSRRESELEKEAHAGELSAGCAEETRESLKRLVMEERPFLLEPPDDICASFPKWDVPSLRPASTPPPKPVLARVNVFEEQSDATTKSSPVGCRALKSLTNTAVTVDQDNGRRRRGKAAVSYKEPSINCKMRRGDKYSDTKFLNSPVFKEKKKKVQVVKLEIDTGPCFNNMD